MSDSSDQLAVSVVIPSRDRPQLLARCLAAVLAALDLLDRPAEVIVVDDGNGSAAEGIPDDPRIRVLLSDGQGPSRARNRGVLLATAPIIVFTDDDATVEPAWLIDAMASFDARPEIMGVKGPVFAPPTDALYEHSIDQVDQGVFITCNIAYRRVALMAVGGLDPSWRLPAHGDRDLGYRISALGEVVYVATMVAHHPVRPFGVREWARRGRFVENDWLLYRRYPEQKPNGMPLRIAPLYGIAARWWQLLIRPEHRVRNPRRFWRWLRLALAQTCVGAWATLTRWRHRPRDPSARPGFAPQGLRIAYLGPTPQRHAGGPPDIAAMILESLVARGHVVDCFVSIGEHDQAAKHLDELVGINIRAIKNPFLFGRWYSKTHLSKMLSGQVLGMLTRRRVGAMLLDEHARTPYDVLYQFSNLELFGISPRNRKQLPPIASHPSVHAAGELRWMRAEAALARACEGRWRPMVIRASLRLRALRQKRDIADVSLLMAISTRFGELIAQDYGFNKANIVTVPNAIDPERFAPLATSASEQPSREFAVLGRIAVRKGIEDLVPLAAQLQAQGSAAQLSVVGSRSLWSNYEPLIAQQQSAQLTWRNAVSRDEIAAWLPSVAALLQPARYEPFGLTVAEA
ncbi:MAG: glycosyltransferase, partial [Actinomycetes bacterium]